MSIIKNFRCISLFNICLMVVLLISCTENEISDLTKNNLIPVPQDLTASGEYFKFNSKTCIDVADANEEVDKIAELLALSCTELSGLNFEILPTNKSKKSNVLSLVLEKEETMGDEEYLIDIEKRRIVLSASQPAGLFRGIQTIKQLLSLYEDIDEAGEKVWNIPTGTIRDYPEFSYRGTMLDVARHFFSVEDVKKYIDQISLYKINVLHLHLADDQGWRIEIKSWPKLTEIGGSTEVGGGEGGFYTQEEYSDIVNYASERFITIIPEIDMPGHTNAALASYPELNCSGVSPELYTGTHVGFSTLCTSLEITYQFIDDVIRELSALTPGSYIHIGGDESHVTALEDYIPFINRVQDIVYAHGKKVIGWDEITHASLKKESVAQYWASSDNAIRAIEQGSQIILSPAKTCYLDMKYNEASPLGLTWMGYIELDSAYMWNPLTLVDGISRKDILGIESPLWGETIETMDDIEYLAFPRLIGHSEIGWSAPESQNWDSYKNRLRNHYHMLDKMEVNYYISPLIEE